MTKEYNKNLSNTSLFGDEPTKKRNSYLWGLKGFRPSTSEVYQTLKSIHTEPYDERHYVRDEARWLALYITDEDFSLDFVIQKTELRREDLRDFFKYYGVDIKKRNLIVGGAK